MGRVWEGLEGIKIRLKKGFKKGGWGGQLPESTLGRYLYRGGLLGVPWALLGASWALLGALGHLLGTSWASLGRSWASLGWSEAPFGRIRAPRDAWGLDF